MKVKIICLNSQLSITNSSYVHYQDEVSGGYGIMQGHDQMWIQIHQGNLAVTYDNKIDYYRVQTGILSVLDNTVCLIVDNYAKTTHRRVSTEV